jgi:hypothetical protein
MSKEKREFADWLDWFDAGELWDWARRHPRTLAGAALLIAALVALAPHSDRPPHSAAEQEETPLFI